ncbi:hypothetical protein CFIICLFH_2559 [Methylobacterium goesingense]|nr:hypothetical protein CFIICLFH_2559 [Methylobacterium goesingense]
MEADAEALAAITRAAEGSVRDALSLLDQAIAHGAGIVSAQSVRDMLGLADRGRIVDLFEAVMRGDIPAAFAEVRGQYEAGADPAVILSDLAGFTHLVTRLKLVPDEAAADPTLSEAERVRGGDFAGKLSVRVLSRAWQILLKAIPEVQTATRPLAAAEMALVRLAYAADLPTPDEALRQMKAQALAGSAAVSGAAQAVSAPGSISAEARPALPPIPTFSAEAPPPRPALSMAANGGGSRPALVNPGLASPVLASPSLASPVLANPAPAPQPEGPRLLRFTDVVALADAKRDIGLKMALEREVHLVRFEEGRIEFRLAEGGRQSIANDLARALDAWTGRRWIVALSKEAGEPTLDDTARAATETRHQNAAAHPLVREVLARFPGAQIVDVRDRAPEASPALEAPPTGEAETEEPDDEA